MRISKYILLASGLFWSCGAASGQQPLTLDTLLAQVMARNPALLAARTRVLGAEARISQARAWDDPLIGVEWYATPVTSLNPFRDGMETDYFVQQMIPFPGKKSLMGEAESARSRVAGRNAAAIERDLVAETKRAYAMVFSAQRRIEVNQENIRLLQQITESARTRYSVGRGTEGDVLKLQVEIAKLRNERSQLDQELASAAAMLNALRAASQDAEIGKVADFTPEEFRWSVEELTAQAAESRPELQGMQFEIEMNRNELAASKKEWLPDFMIKGTYKQMVEGTDQWAAMIGINLPIAPWSSGKYAGRVEEQEQTLRANEQSLADMRNMIRSQVRDAYAKALSRRQQYDRYRDDILPQAERALQTTLTAYQTDKTDFLSLLDSYRMLRMLRMEYYMAIGEYAASLATLERTVGTSLN